MNRLEVYRRSDGRWAWREVASNGEVIATDGGQGYENRCDAVEMGQKVTGLDVVPDDGPEDAA